MDLHPEDPDEPRVHGLVRNQIAGVENQGKQEHTRVLGGVVKRLGSTAPREANKKS